MSPASASPQPVRSDGPWTLAIDFGTSFTVAAAARVAGVDLIPLGGSKGDRYRMPSAVALDDGGDFAVGISAIEAGHLHPERFEPSPKRLVGWGDVMIADRVMAVTEVLAAVFGNVAAAGRQVSGGRDPSRVVVTHPASWGTTRLQVLHDAAEAAGLDDAELVPDPVAAAMHLGAARLRVGALAAVYDFGAGSLDVAVLRRTAEGFELAAPPGGRDLLSGEEIEARIIDHLGNGPIGQHPDWAKLMYPPPDPDWLRHGVEFRREIREAKEALSNQTVCQIPVPGLGREVQLSRVELDDLIRDDIISTVETLRSTAGAAGIEMTDLDVILMVGGSSRIPLVAHTIWEETGLKPIVPDDPQSVIAAGAARARPARGDRSSRRFVRAQTFNSRLALATRTAFWNSGAYCYGYLTVTLSDRGEDGYAQPPGSVCFSDEPTVGNLEAVAEAGAARWSSQAGYGELSLEKVDWLGSPSLERWFVLGDDQWVERYTIQADRWFVGLAPASLAARLDTVSLRRTSGDPLYELPWSCELASGDRVHERLELIRAKSGYRVTAESYDGDSDWGQRRIDTYRSHPGYTWLKQSSSRLLGSPGTTWQLGLTDGVPGQMHSFFVSGPSGNQQTRVWVGQAAARTYSVVATLPEQEKLSFRLLQAHATLVNPGSTLSQGEGG